MDGQFYVSDKTIVAREMHTVITGDYDIRIKFGRNISDQELLAVFHQILRIFENLFAENDIPKEGDPECKITFTVDKQSWYEVTDTIDMGWYANDTEKGKEILKQREEGRK